MLMVLPNLTDPLGICQGCRQVAAVGYNQVGPLWLMGYERWSQSSLNFIVPEIGRADRHRRATQWPTGRPNSPGGLMAVRGPQVDLVDFDLQSVS